MASRTPRTLSRQQVRHNPLRGRASGVSNTSAVINNCRIAGVGMKATKYVIFNANRQAGAKLDTLLQGNPLTLLTDLNAIESRWDIVQDLHTQRAFLAKHGEMSAAEISFPAIIVEHHLLPRQVINTLLLSNKSLILFLRPEKAHTNTLQSVWLFGATSTQFQRVITSIELIRSYMGERIRTNESEMVYSFLDVPKVIKVSRRLLTNIAINNSFTPINNSAIDPESLLRAKFLPEGFAYTEDNVVTYNERINSDGTVTVRYVEFSLSWQTI
jgi:hypothetical protein